MSDGITDSRNGLHAYLFGVHGKPVQSMLPSVVPKDASGELNWKQSARNPGQHKIWQDFDRGFMVTCAACGHTLNDPNRIDCISCGADGIAEAARVFFAGKGKSKGKDKMKNDFEDAVNRIGTDRPKQYVFTVEVVVRDEDMRDDVLSDASEMIRTIGSFDIMDVEELESHDQRWI